MATPDFPSAGPPSSARTSSRTWTRPDSRKRRLLLAVFVYLVAGVIVYAAFAGSERLGEHTPFNHYALLADAWLHGRQDLAHGPPAYAMNNDFAEFNGKTYISFPPFPAVLMLPLVKLAGSPENFRDGQFVIWLAGIAPAVLLLVLEKLRRTGRSPRTELENVLLALLFAFGTVYFFTAVEGTVWFAAMVVGTACQALYVLFSLDAEQPALAGAMLGCAFLSRPTMLFAVPLFALEALRMACSEFPRAPRSFSRRRSEPRSSSASGRPGAGSTGPASPGATSPSPFPSCSRSRSTRGSTTRAIKRGAPSTPATSTSRWAGEAG